MIKCKRRMSRQTSLRFKESSGNCNTSTYSSSLNVSTHPLLSVRETIVTSALKLGLIAIGIPSGINNPFVSITNDFKIESSKDTVKILVDALETFIVRNDSSFLQIGLTKR